jgi:hypothetical protein
MRFGVKPCLSYLILTGRVLSSAGSALPNRWKLYTALLPQTFIETRMLSWEHWILACSSLSKNFFMELTWFGEKSCLFFRMIDGGGKYPHSTAYLIRHKEMPIALEAPR